MISLVMMMVWLTAGVAFLAYQLATGRAVTILNSGIPAWTACAALALFNFARWYATTAGRDDERALRIAEESRRRQARQRSDPPEYDPNLDFTRKEGSEGPPR